MATINPSRAYGPSKWGNALQGVVQGLAHIGGVYEEKYNDKQEGKDIEDFMRSLGGGASGVDNYNSPITGAKAGTTDYFAEVLGPQDPKKVAEVTDAFNSYAGVLRSRVREEFGGDEPAKKKYSILGKDNALASAFRMDAQPQQAPGQLPPNSQMMAQAPMGQQDTMSDVPPPMPSPVQSPPMGPAGQGGGAFSPSNYNSPATGTPPGSTNYFEGMQPPQPQNMLGGQPQPGAMPQQAQQPPDEYGEKLKNDPEAMRSLQAIEADVTKNTPSLKDGLFKAVSVLARKGNTKLAMFALGKYIDIINTETKGKLAISVAQAKRLQGLEDSDTKMRNEVLYKRADEIAYKTGKPINEVYNALLAQRDISVPSSGGGVVNNLDPTSSGPTLRVPTKADEIQPPDKIKFTQPDKALEKVTNLTEGLTTKPNPFVKDLKQRNYAARDANRKIHDPLLIKDDQVIYDSVLQLLKSQTGSSRMARDIVDHLAGGYIIGDFNKKLSYLLGGSREWLHRAKMDNFKRLVKGEVDYTSKELKIVSDQARIQAREYLNIIERADPAMRSRVEKDLNDAIDSFNSQAGGEGGGSLMDQFKEYQKGRQGN